jgi:hypothetical protein
MSSEQLASGNLIFGSWDEVVIGDWGVLELSTDNGGTRFNQAQVGIRALWMVDVLLRYPQAFVVGRTCRNARPRASRGVHRCRPASEAGRRRRPGTRPGHLPRRDRRSRAGEGRTQTKEVKPAPEKPGKKEKEAHA